MSLRCRLIKVESYLFYSKHKGLSSCKGNEDSINNSVLSGVVITYNLFHATSGIEDTSNHFNRDTYNLDTCICILTEKCATSPMVLNLFFYI